MISGGNHLGKGRAGYGPGRPASPPSCTSPDENTREYRDGFGFVFCFSGFFCFCFFFMFDQFEFV